MLLIILNVHLKIHEHDHDIRHMNRFSIKYPCEPTKMNVIAATNDFSANIIQIVSRSFNRAGIKIVVHTVQEHYRFKVYKTLQYKMFELYVSLKPAMRLFRTSE